MLRIVGDVHGKINQYVNIVKDCDYSLQIGDMGFYYDDLKALNPGTHKFLGGNHDNYDLYYDCPYALGDFGQFYLGGVDFFYIRGAFSIDYVARIEQEMLGRGRSLWKQEQLDYETMDAAVELYKNVKPRIMMTHSCPRQVAKHIGNPKVLQSWNYNPDTFTTGTQEALQECFEYHQPKYWFYGHFHQSRIDIINNTNFVCLNELNYVDFNGDKLI